MPFIRKTEVEQGVIGIWELKEKADNLIDIFAFTEHETVEFSRFIGEKRKKEYLATRLLLQHLLGEKAEIVYQQSGKPGVKDSSLNISISHSADFVVLFLSNVLGGIDIENADRNTDRAAKRFLHQKEMEWIGKSEDQQFLKILFWCAKEAIFKCSLHSGIQFNSQIYIEPFDFRQTHIFCGKLKISDVEVKYNLHYFQIQNNIMVYCVEG